MVTITADKTALAAFIIVASPAIYSAIPKNKAQTKEIFDRLGRNVKLNISETEKLLLTANLDMPVEQFNGLRLGLMLLGVALIPLFMLFNAWMLGLLIAGAGYMLPVFWLKNKATARKQALRKQMPTFLMFFSCALTAGADTLRAFKESAAKAGEPIKSEVEKLLNEINAGKPIAEAIMDMANRVDLDEMHTLAKTIAQSYRYGSELAEDMKNQSIQFRAARRFDAMETANKLTVKLIFPVLIFMLVPCLIAIGFPAGVALMNAFK